MTVNANKERHPLKKVVATALSFCLAVMSPIWIEDIHHVKLIGTIITLFLIASYIILYTLPLDTYKIKFIKPNKSTKNKPDIYINIISEIIPDSLTIIRPAIGVATAIYLFKGKAIYAFGLYYIGLLSDVFDGMFARALKGTTAWGKNFDAYADSIFNFTTGVGIISYSIFLTQNYYQIFIISLIELAFILRKYFIKIKDNTIVAKFFSGFVRVVLFIFLWSYLPEKYSLFGIVAGAILLIFGGSYELLVTRKELQNGIRTIY